MYEYSNGGVIERASNSA